jgi:hypothetical protein
VEIIGFYIICQESPIGGADVGGIQKWLISARTASTMSQEVSSTSGVMLIQQKLNNIDENEE